MILKSKISFLLVAVSFFAVACSSDSTTPQAGAGGHGSGGQASSGGKTGSGGANTGGTSSQGSGGASTGGNAATGGVSATGGTSAKSGGSAAGGTPSQGGTAGDRSGGAGGAAGAAGTGGTTPVSGGKTGTDAGAGGGGSGGQSGGAGGQSLDASPGTGGSGGGGGGYNPCKASPCVILPLGDSITHGFGSTDDSGYRSPLFKAIVAANQKVTFIGSLSNGPSTVSGETFPKKHEGHDGISISGITGWVPPAKAFPATPHIVLLHIGTNDMTSNADPTTAANQLDTLVGNLAKAAPDALIVVAKIIPLFYASTTYNNYAAKIPGIVSAHAAKSEHVVMVDMTSFPSSDFGNGVHPNDQGYAFMGNLWYQAIKAYLP